MKQVRYFSFSKELSHSVISKICLAYLLQFNTSEPLDMNLGISSPLADYAAKYWIIHAHSGCQSKFQSSSVSALILKLLTDENAFLKWVQIYDIDDPYMGLKKWGDEIAKPLYYASLAGLTEASHVLSERMTDINAKGGHYGNALQAASFEGHEAIAKQLIERGADVNAHGGYFGNALKAASYGGHEALTKLLIDKGADVNASGGPYGTALQLASYQGHMAIAKLLINKGADVNAQGGLVGKALQAALFKDHMAIAKLLLDNGAM